jgi:hypothetical protein
MQLATKEFPPTLEDRPVVLVIGAHKHDWPDFYPRWVSDRTGLLPHIEILAPATAEAIDPANLLFDDAGVPLRVQEYDIATLFMEIEALPPNL